MEIVNELDIDGYRWEIRDRQAREDILKLKSDTGVIDIGEIDLVLKPGYTAYYAKLQHVMKMGKLISGSIHFINLEGPGIGENKPLLVAEFPFKVKGLFELVMADTWRNFAYRASVSTAKEVTLISSVNLKQNDADIKGSFICFEE